MLVRTLGPEGGVDCEISHLRRTSILYKGVETSL